MRLLLVLLSIITLASCKKERCYEFHVKSVMKYNPKTHADITTESDFERCDITAKEARAMDVVYAMDRTYETPTHTITVTSTSNYHVVR